MILDMRPMLRGEVDHIHIDYLLTPDLPDGAEFEGDARVVGDIVDEAGYMRLTLTASVVYHAECARCLEPVSGDFAVQLERTVAAEGTLTEEQLEENVDELVGLCMKLLSKKPLAVIYNSYTTGLSASAVAALLAVNARRNGFEDFSLFADEVGLPITKKKVALPCGAVARLEWK